MHRIYIFLFVFSLLHSNPITGMECNPRLDIKCAYLKAWSYKDTNLDSAMYYCDISFNLIDNSTSKITMSKAHTVRGILLQKMNQFDESFSELKKALDYKLALGDSVEIAKGYSNLGNTLLLGNRFLLAKFYYSKCLSYSIPDSDSNTYVANCSNLGLLYKSLEQQDSARAIFKLAEPYIGYKHYYQSSSDLYFNIAKLYRSQLEFDSAITYLNKAILIQGKNEDYLGLGMSYVNLAFSYQMKGDFFNASSCYMVADSCSQMVDNLQLDADIQKGKFLLPFYQTSDKTKLNQFHRWYDIEYQLTQKKIESNIADVEAQYQNKLKDEELKLAQEKSDKIEAISERNYWLAVTGGGLAISLAGIGFFVNKYRKQKHKIKEERMFSEFNEALNEQEIAVITKSNEAKNKERIRISTEIHDNISSKLTAISTALQSEKPIDREQLKVHLKESMTQLRAVAHDLANEAELGNTMEANLLALNQLLDGSDIEFKPYLEGLPKNLDHEIEKHLFRIVMELMNNSLKHADCTEIVLDIMKVEGDLIVLFEDNGKGFDPEKQKKGLGLYSIEKRVSAIQAELTIDSKLERGSTFIIKIPLI